MAESELSSTSRTVRAQPRSSHGDLLHTIAQLREQRNAASALLNSSTNKPPSQNHRSDSSSFHHRSPSSSSSTAAPSATSGRRRLCKPRSSAHVVDRPSYNLADELEDWHDSEDNDSCAADSLAETLDKLSIVNGHLHNHAQSEMKPVAHKQKTRILDSFAVLDKVSRFGTSVKEEQDDTSLDDSENNNFVDLGSDKCSDEDDDFVPVSRVKQEPSSRSHGTAAKAASKISFEEICNDPIEDKENSGSGAVTYVHGKTVYRLPPNIAKILYPHQHEGIKWLWGLHVKNMGGILGDDMGLGKTMQIASFFVGLFTSNLIKRALVVAPKTLIAHWCKELTFVGLGRKTKDYSGTSASQRSYALQHVLQSGGVLLTTYDVVRNNWQALRGDFHGRDGFGDTSEDIITWDYMVLDEGHLIKNPSTQRAKSLREIPCAHRIILSGTPIQNNLREMWALFDFCCPQLLGDKKEFKARYEDSILSANSKDSTDRQKRIGSAVAQELRKRIAPFFLRRMKSEVFSSSASTDEHKLSKKTDIIVWLRLTQRQRELYTGFLQSKTAHQSLEGSALAALTVLKKICDHPCLLTQRAADDIAEGMESMLSTEDVAAAEAMSAAVAKLMKVDEDREGSHGEASCKIAFLTTLLDKLVSEGHRTLIFAQTRKMLDIIQKEVSCKRYRFRRIDGTMKAADREKCVQEFQTDPHIPVFLLTSKVGGLGLTLTAADRVVIVDPAWNPSTDNQSVDRAYRIGQKLDVIIYRLMTSGTIEEKIYRKQVFKGGLSKVATEHKEQFRYFSQQELKELLTLPKTGFDISLTQQQLHEEHSGQYESIRDQELKSHIKFLEKQNIAGVSHHDLLFSKQAPELPTPVEEPLLTWDAQKWRYGTSNASVSRKELPTPECESLTPQEWARANIEHKIILPDTKESFLERQKRDVSANISRLCQTLENKALISRLPDNGENLRRKLDDLTNQLKSLEYISVAENDSSEDLSSGTLNKKSTSVTAGKVNVKEEVIVLSSTEDSTGHLNHYDVSLKDTASSGVEDVKPKVRHNPDSQSTSANAYKSALSDVQDVKPNIRLHVDVHSASTDVYKSISMPNVKPKVKEESIYLPSREENRKYDKHLDASSRNTVSEDVKPMIDHRANGYSATTDRYKHKDMLDKFKFRNGSKDMRMSRSELNSDYEDVKPFKGMKKDSDTSTEPKDTKIVCAPKTEVDDVASYLSGLNL